MSPRCHPIASIALSLVVTAAARADCIEDAAAHHQVNAVVLRAIGWNESRLDPAAVGRNANGSIDIGAFQINSAHLPELARHGVSARALADGCVSAYVAAWHYRHQVDRLGNTWAAVGSYHSRTPARLAWYANRIAAILMAWGALPHTALPYPGAAPPHGPSDPPAAASRSESAAQPATRASTDLLADSAQAPLFDAIATPSGMR